MTATAVGVPLAADGGWFAVVGFVLGIAGPGVLFVLPGFGLLASIARRREVHAAEAVAVVMVGAGAAFMAVFWAYMWSPVAGHVAAVLAALGGAAFWSRNTRGPSPAFLPFLLGISVAIVAGSVAFSAGGAAGGEHSVAERYWLAPDNAIPLIIGERLVAGDSLRTPPILSGWQVTDRPPLQAGATVALLPLFDNDSLGYQFAGVALQSWWVPALVAMLLALGFTRRRALLAIPLVATTSAVYLNTVYVWPKLLAAALVLAGVAAARTPTRRSGLWILVGSSALGLLAHGGVAFAFPVCAWVARQAFAKLSWSSVAGAVALGLVLYAPWMACQRLYDPPGDRLLRWHLAGDLRGVGPPFTEVLLDSYRMPPADVVKAKARNLAALTITPWEWRANKATPAWTDAEGVLRNALTLNLLPVPGLLLPAVLTLRRDRRAWPLVALSAGTALTSVLIEHGGSWDAAAWTRHTSYVALISWAGAGAVGTLALPLWVRRVVIAAHVLAFVWLWLFLGRTSALNGEGFGVSVPAWATALLGCLAIAAVVRVGSSPDTGLRTSTTPSLGDELPR